MSSIDSQPHSAEDPNRIIRREIQRLGDEIRARHPILAHQDAIGMTLLLGSAFGVLALGVAYGMGLLPAFVVLPASTVLLSILHELEHDLIHRLYFRGREGLMNFAMGVVWLFRPSTISPWVRKDWHLHHHRVSGHGDDIEERAITNGETWGLRRFAMTFGGALSVVLRPKTVVEFSREYVASQSPKDDAERRAMRRRIRTAFLPLGPVHSTLFYGFVFGHIASMLAGPLGLASLANRFLAPVLPAVDLLAVAWVLPNVLRTFCLHFVSSNLHYYGDVREGNIVQQTQVWTSPLMWPFQLFCFNFGSTHAIHHFVVRDPFYLRQMIASDAHTVMRANGVRFNDFGTFARANRYTIAQAA